MSGKSEVEDIVFSPVAAAQVVLNRESKNEGALLIDIGGGTTDYICFVDGAVVESGCVPIGGDHITNDIALVLKTHNAKKEKLKVNHGSASLRNIEHDEIAIEVDSGKTVEQELLNQIMNARATELLSVVAEPLQQQGLLDKLGKGIFLTGGDILIPAKSQFTGYVRTHLTDENPSVRHPWGCRYAQLLDEQTSG